MLRARLYSCQVSHIRNRIGSRRPTGGSSVRDDFEDMHAADADDEQRIDELDVPTLSDWPKAALHQILPCPSRVPQDVCKGEHIAIWFGTGYNKWVAGVVNKVDM